MRLVRGGPVLVKPAGCLKTSRGLFWFPVISKKTKPARGVGLGAMKEILVTTRCFYAGIYDEASPANVAGFAKRGIARGDWFDFNQILIDGTARGELLAWTLLFDGVFRAVIEIAGPLPGDAGNLDPIENLGRDELTADLSFPSGRLIVACLSSLG